LESFSRFISEKAAGFDFTAAQHIRKYSFRVKRAGSTYLINVPSLITAATQVSKEGLFMSLRTAGFLIT
jgi:hypothetical protein